MSWEAPPVLRKALLTGSERRALHDAMLEGTTRESLIIALGTAEPARDYDTIVTRSSFDGELFELIRDAERGGWLFQLISVFSEMTRREDLLDIAEQVRVAADARLTRYRRLGMATDEEIRGPLRPVLVLAAVVALAAAALVFPYCRLDSSCTPNDPNFILELKRDGEIQAEQRVAVGRVVSGADEARSQVTRTNTLGEAFFRVELSRDLIYAGGAWLDRGDGVEVCTFPAFRVTEELRRSIDLDPVVHCASEETTETMEYQLSALRTVAPEEFAATRAAPETLAELADAMETANGSPRGSLPVPVTAPNVIRFPGFGNAIGNAGTATIGAPSVASAPTVFRFGHRPPFGLPDAPVTLERLYYTLGFDPEIRLMRWAAFTIDTQRTSPAPRRAQFRFDPDIPEGVQTGNEAYQNNPYDRATMVRRADSLIGGTPDNNAQLEREALYYSVTVPQPDATNRRTWLAVEEFATDLSRDIGPIHTVAGPVFPKVDAASDALLVIGPDLTLVPTELFRVHLRDTVDGWRSIAFLVPNDGMAAEDPTAFVTSVAEIERLTGLTFFPDLDPADEGIKQNADLDAFVDPAPRNEQQPALVIPDMREAVPDRSCDAIPWDSLRTLPATVDLERLISGRFSASQSVRLAERPAFRLLTVTEDQQGRYALTLSSNTSDPTLTLYRIGSGGFPPDCDVLQFNDDGDGALNSRIEIDLDPGRYIIRTARFPNSPTGSAELNIVPIERGTSP